MSHEEAVKFFSLFFGGEHHIPGNRKLWGAEAVRPHGTGFYIETRECLSTYDFSNLTMFVVMCHDNRFRGEIKPSSFGSMKMCIWKRCDEPGSVTRHHPTMEENVARIRNFVNAKI